MSDEDIVDGAVATVDSTRRSPLVTRNPTAVREKYTEYREDLRTDFFYSCAYCSISEAESAGFRFTIDHYEPSSARPDLKSDYSNLMYCCDQCNMRKGDICPPQSARDEGFRFFRPDQDALSDHFKLEGQRIKHLSVTGDFTIDYLDLNRNALIVVRNLRSRLADCHARVLEGVRGLRRVRIDQLPVDVRGRALRAIQNMSSVQLSLEDAVDKVLKEDAKSPLLDVDEGAGERAKERAEAMKELKALHPGQWRGRGSPKTT